MIAKWLRVCAVLGSIACAIEYRVPAADDASSTDTDSDGATVDLGDDECEHLCDDVREICVDGGCACRAGFADCDGVCVDLETDPEHCGQCDRDCGGDPCGAGECQTVGCGAFPDRCGDSCTDVQSDPLHCRECDRACDGDEMCIDGDCDDAD